MNTKITIAIMQTIKIDDSKIYFHKWLSVTITGSGGASELQDLVDTVESKK
jgi:hypothetical protein